MHFIPNDNREINHLKNREVLEDYVKIFLNTDDFLIWSRIFPYDETKILQLIEQKMRNNLRKGELNRCLKLSMIRFSILKADNSLLTLARYFFSIAEPFYNFSKEAQTMFYMFQILKQQIQLNLENKIKLKSIAIFFEDFRSKLLNYVYDYGNIYLEGIGISILNLLQNIEYIFKNNVLDNGKLNIAQYQINKISSYCVLICKHFFYKCVLGDCLIFTYKNLLEKEYEISILR